MAGPTSSEFRAPATWNIHSFEKDLLPWNDYHGRTRWEVKKAIDHSMTPTSWLHTLAAAIEFKVKGDMEDLEKNGIDDKIQ